MNTYRQSELVNYFDCPRKFKLSLTADRKKSKLMAEGHLFEGLVFGFKYNHFHEFDIPLDSDIDTLPAKKFGIQEPSLLAYKIAAKHAKTFFLEGDSYVKLRYEGPNWCLQGEADFIGDVMYRGNQVRCIADLKFTGDIVKNWHDKEANFKSFIQSIVYPFIHYKNTGEILPFVYVIVDNDKSLLPNETPYVKQMRHVPTLKEFELLEAFIDTVDSDFEFKHNPNSCVTGPYWNYECPYMRSCEIGRQFKEIAVEIPELELAL